MKRIVLWTALALGLLAILPATGAGVSPESVRVLIEFTDPPGAADVAALKRAGGMVDHVYKIVPAIAATVPASALPGLEANPRVTKVELDGVVTALDYRSTHDWGIAHIRADQVHASGNTGTGVRVAIVDTGTSCQQLELAANCQFGPTFVDGTSSSDDDNGHGTHVGGTVAAVRNPSVSTGVVGVAPTATVISYKVLDSGGGGFWSDIIAAIDHIWNNGNKRAEVVNMSLGGSSAPSELEAAMNRAYSSGIVLVAAAGNGGNCAGTGDSVSHPARYNSVIAVAAVQQDNTRPCFSATGAQVELAAPGVSVFSTWAEDRPTSANNPQPVCENGICYYKYGSGTSMASPHAAGAAALVIASGVTDANGVNGVADEVQQRLNQTALDLGSTGRDAQYGYGLVDAAAAANTGPTIMTSSLADGTIGVAYSQSLAATGGTPPYSFDLAPGSTALPPGLSLSAAGLISGTPTTAGTYPFTARVTDSAAKSSTKALSIEVGTPVTITTTSLPDGVAGQAYSQTLAATGGTTPYSWSIVAGSLPPGLTLGSSTGTISGTPTTAGTYNFTAQVTDGATPARTDQHALSIVIQPGLSIITSSPLSPCKVGSTCTRTIEAAGGTPLYTWTIVSGSLPPELTLSSTGTITGAPSKPGNYAFTVQVTDSGSPALTATKTFSLKINKK